MEADETNVHTVEGVIVNPVKKRSSPLEWISFEIDDKAVYVLHSRNRSLIERLSQEGVSVTVTYPEYDWKNPALFLMESRSEQVIRIVDSADGTVYFDCWDEHNASMRGTRIVFLGIVAVVLFIVVSLLALDLYISITCRRHSKKRPKSERVRAPSAVLTPEQRKQRSKSRRRKKMRAFCCVLAG